MHIENGEIAKAELAFKEALKLDPEYKTATSNLAFLYLKLALSYKDKGDIKKALDNYQKAFSYYPEKTFILEEEKEVEPDSSGS